MLELFRLSATRIRRLQRAVLAACLLVPLFGCPSSGPPPIVEPGPPVLRATAESITLTPSSFLLSTPPASLSLEIRLKGDTYPPQLDFEAEVFVAYVASAAIGELEASETIQVPLEDLSGDAAYVGTIVTSALLDKPSTTGGSLRQRLNFLGAENVSVRLAGKILGAAPGIPDGWSETNTLDSSLPPPDITGLSPAAFRAGDSAAVEITGHNLRNVTAALVDGPEGIETGSVSSGGDAVATVGITIASDADVGNRTLRLLGPGGLSPVTSLARLSVIDPLLPNILTASLPPAQTGEAYSVQLASQGGTGAVSWAFRSGSFPAGLTISSNGILSGTPATPGTYVFDLSVRDQAFAEDRRTFILDVTPPPGDGRDALALPCDAFADQTASFRNVTTPERATGAPDPAFGSLTESQPAVAGYFPASLSLVSQLQSGSYLVLDMGPSPCEWIQGRASRTADAWLDVGGPYRPAMLVWLSASPLTLDRLVMNALPGAGSIGSGRFPINAGSDGSLYRYVMIALVDPSPARIDAVERVQNDTVPPETYTPNVILREGGVAQANGRDAAISMSGDDTLNSSDPLGRIGNFEVALFNLTTGMDGPADTVPSVNGFYAETEFTDLDDGDHELVVTAVDLFENADPTPATAIFRVDSTGPEISAIQISPSAAVIPTGGSYELAVSALVEDGLSEITIVEGSLLGPGGPYSFSLSLMSENNWTGTVTGLELAGSYTVDISAYDDRGNLSVLNGGSALLTANLPPVVQPGSSFSAPELSLVTLDASGTIDPEGNSVTFMWEQISGPAVTLQGSGVSVSFFAPEIFTNTPLPLTFQVTATDSEGASATGNITVTVTNINEPPVVNAGMDVTIPDSGIHFLAGAAIDPEGDTPTLLWAQLSGPAVSLSGTTTTSPSFSPPSAAGGDVTLVFQLAATDSLLATGTDTITIIVSVVDKPPVAIAGNDQNVFDTAPLFLDGSASFDPEGGGVSYLWSLIAGNSAHLPGWAALNKTTATLSLPQITAGMDETFTFQLQVRDGINQTHTDTVNVNVKRLCIQVLSLTSSAKPAGSVIDQAVDGDRQFVLFDGNSTLFSRDWQGGSRGEFALAGGPALLMAHDPDRRLLWIASLSLLERIDLNSMTSDTRSLTSAPLAAAVDTGTGRVAVLTAAGGGRLEFFSTAGTAETYLDLGRPNPEALLLAPSVYNSRFIVADTEVPAVLAVDPSAPSISMTFDLPGPYVPDQIAANPTNGDIAVAYSGGILELTEGGGLLVNRTPDAEPASHYDVLYTDDGYLLAARGLGYGETTPARTLYRTRAADFTATAAALPDPGDIAVNHRKARSGDHLAADGTSTAVSLEARSWGPSRLHIVTGTAAPHTVSTVELGHDEPVSVRVSGGKYFVLTSGGDIFRITPPSTVETDRPSARLASMAVDSSGRLLAADQRSRRIWKVAGQSPTIAVTRKEADGIVASMVAANAEPLVNLTGRDRTGAISALVLASTANDDLWAGPVPHAGGFVVPPVKTTNRVFSARGNGSLIEIHDLFTGNLVESLPTTIDPVRLAVDSDGTRLAAVDPVQKKVALFSLTPPGAEQIFLTGNGPSELAFNADGSRLLVRERVSGRLLVIDTVSGTSLGQITIPVTAIPDPLDLSAIGRRSIVFHAPSNSFYVTSGQNLLRVSGDGLSSQLISPAALSNFTSIDVIGNYVALVDGGRRFYLVDPAENYRVSRINLPVIPIDGSLNLIAGDPAGNLLYVGGEHTVSVIDFRVSCSTARPVTYAQLVHEEPLRFWARLTTTARGFLQRFFSPLGTGAAVSASCQAPLTVLALSNPMQPNEPTGGGFRSPVKEGALP